MMAREQDISETYNPWPKIGWATTAGIVVVSAVLGFGLLDRYQQAAPRSAYGAQFAADSASALTPDRRAEPQPPLRTPTLIAWTNATLDQITAGNAEHGAFVTLICTACHGEHGISQSALYPDACWDGCGDHLQATRRFSVRKAVLGRHERHRSSALASRFGRCCRLFCRSAGRPAGTNRRSGAGVGPQSQAVRSCQTPDICWRSGARYPTLLGVSWSRRVQARSACAARAAS